MDQKKKLNELTKLSSEMSSTEMENLMATHCDMFCNVCSAEFKSLPDAQYHYSNEHNTTDGYIRCCSLKIKTIKKLQGHLIFHKMPEIFK